MSASRGLDVVQILYPSGSLTASAAAVPTVAVNGTTVTVTHAHAGADALAFGTAGALVTLTRGGKTTVVLRDSDIDMARSQGEVGLTTLDAGYDFGVVPDWLVAQRLHNEVYDWPIAAPPSDALRTRVRGSQK